MSSIQEELEKMTVNNTITDEKNNEKKVINKRGNFFRSSSFQKLKCTAYYPVQLAGTTFSKESLTKLFELLIKKSRDGLQKALLILSLPVFRIIGATICCWLYFLVKIFGINLLMNEKTVFEINDQNVKTELDKNEAITLNKTDDNNNTNNNNNNNNNTIGVRRTHRKYLKRNSNMYSSNESIMSTSSSFTSTPSSSTLSLLNDQRNANLLLNEHTTFNFILYYSGAIFVHLQVLLLVIALSSTITSIGLIFLLASFLFMSYITIRILQPKINVDNKKSKRNGSKKKVSSSPSSNGITARSTANQETSGSSSSDSGSSKTTLNPTKTVIAKPSALMTKTTTTITTSQIIMNSTKLQLNDFNDKRKSINTLL